MLTLGMEGTLPSRYCVVGIQIAREELFVPAKACAFCPCAKVM